MFVYSVRKTAYEYQVQKLESANVKAENNLVP